MNAEKFVSLSLAIVLLAVAGYFAWRQRRTWHMLRGGPGGGAHGGNGTAEGLTGDEKQFFLRQIRRRLTCSVFMAVFAVMLFGWFLVVDKVDALRPTMQENVVEGPEVPAADPNQLLVQMVVFYWMAALFVLFIILALAAVDFMATTRYGMRQRRRLEADTQSILALEAARLRMHYPENN